MSDEMRWCPNCCARLVGNQIVCATCRIVPSREEPQAPTFGVKYDGGKPRWSLLPWDVLREVVEVLELGARKYSPGNWRKVPDARTRYFDATLRHLTAWWAGEDRDPETGRSHLAHALCCVAFLRGIELGNKEAPR